MDMYFWNKFNKEIQQLTRSMENIGGSVDLNNKNTNKVFEFQGEVHVKDKYEPDYIKVYPLLMYEDIQSSNPEDIIYNKSDLEQNRYDAVAICENKPGTIITCGRRNE